MRSKVLLILGFCWGNNVATFGSFTNSETFGHEFGHIYQVQKQGWANMQSLGIWEQIFMKGNPYTTPGTNEYRAEEIYQYFRFRKLYGF